MPSNRPANEKNNAPATNPQEAADQQELLDAEQELAEHQGEEEYEGLTAEDIVKINREADAMEAELYQEELRKAQQELAEHQGEEEYEGLTAEDIVRINRAAEAELQQMEAQLAQEAAQSEQDALLQQVNQAYSDASPVIDNLQKGKAPTSDLDALYAQLEQEEQELTAKMQAEEEKKKNDLLHQVNQAYQDASPVVDNLQQSKAPQNNYRSAERTAQLKALEDAAAVPHISQMDQVILEATQALNRYVDSPNPMTPQDAREASKYVAILAVGEYVRKEREYYPNGNGPFESQFKGMSKDTLAEVIKKDPKVTAAVDKMMPYYSRTILASLLVDRKARKITGYLVEQSRIEAMKQKSAEANPAIESQQAPKVQQSAPKQQIPNQQAPKVQQSAPKQQAPRNNFQALQTAQREDARIKNQIVQMKEALEKADEGVLFGTKKYDNVTKCVDELMQSWSYGAEAMNPGAWNNKLIQVQQTAETYLASHAIEVLNGTISPVTQRRVAAVAAVLKFSQDRIKELAPHVKAKGKALAQKNKAAGEKAPKEVKPPVKSQNLPGL